MITGGSVCTYFVDWSRWTHPLPSNCMLLPVSPGVTRSSEYRTQQRRENSQCMEEEMLKKIGREWEIYQNKKGCTHTRSRVCSVSSQQYLFVPRSSCPSIWISNYPQSLVTLLVASRKYYFLTRQTQNTLMTTKEHSDTEHIYVNAECDAHKHCKALKNYNPPVHRLFVCLKCSRGTCLIKY